MPDPLRVAAIFDLDHTITKQDTYLAFLLSILSKRPKRWWRSMVWLPLALALYQLKLRDNSWLKETFLDVIAGGASREQIKCWVERFLTRLLDKGIRGGALDAIRRHREAGHHLVMISASFDFYTEELGQRLGFEKVICTRSVWDPTGNLRGELEGGNCYGHTKVSRLETYFGDQRHQWYLIGYSDHHSDLPLLQWVDRPVVINPTAPLAKIAVRYEYEMQRW
jgi:phosphatidylglycerophosphatase C